MKSGGEQPPKRGRARAKVQKWGGLTLLGSSQAVRRSPGPPPHPKVASP